MRLSERCLDFFVDEIVDGSSSMTIRLLLLKDFSREMTELSSARCKRSLLIDASIFLVCIDEGGRVCCSSD